MSALEPHYKQQNWHREKKSIAGSDSALKSLPPLLKRYTCPSPSNIASVKIRNTQLYLTNKPQGKNNYGDLCVRVHAFFQ